MSEYAEGGHIGIEGGQLAPVRLHPDECLIRMTRDRGPLRCVRGDHPTPTSDCTTNGSWIRHQSVDGGNE